MAEDETFLELPSDESGEGVQDYASTPPDPGVFRETLEFRKNLKKYVALLAGAKLVYDPKTDEARVENRKGSVLVDEVGVNIIELALSAVVQKGTVLSNLPHRADVNVHMRSLCIPLVMAMRDNYEHFGGDDNTNLSLIFSHFKLMAFNTLMRALGDAEKRFMSKTERRTEVTKRVGGFLDMFYRGKNR